jgi:presenilin-like A22 family membrane protease
MLGRYIIILIIKMAFMKVIILRVVIKVFDIECYFYSFIELITLFYNRLQELNVNEWSSTMHKKRLTKDTLSYCYKV